MCFASPKPPKPIVAPKTNINPVEEATEFAFNPLAIERKAGIDQLRNDENPLAIKKKTNNNTGV